MLRPEGFPDAVQIAELNYLDTHRWLLQRGTDHPPQNDQTAAKTRTSPLYVRPFRDKRKPGTVIRRMSAPIEVPILILEEGSGIADDPFAGLFLRA